MEELFFNSENLSEPILKGIKKMGFTEPTPIQEEAIPPALMGKDIVAQAPTGTGKTCAFGIPIAERTNPEDTYISSVILCPTRELVIQTANELSDILKYKKGVKIIPVYGGQPIERQISLLKGKPQIVVATPGRLMDHLRRKTIRLTNLEFLVLDEADEMLDMGFREDLDVILLKAPKERQTVLFSATLSDEIKEIAKKYLKEDITYIKTTKEELTVSTVKQYYCQVKEPNRVEAISRIIDANNYKLCIVFCNTKKKVDEICANFRMRKYPVDALHGDMKQMQRDRVMSRFKKGITGILVATDVAARGIDVNDIDCVFNYEIPEDFEYYVHRIGRTGRAKKEGISYTFVSGREVKKLKELSRYTKSEINLVTPPSLSEVKAVNLEKIVESAKNICENCDLNFYTDYLKRVTKDFGFSSNDFAAALLKLMSEGEKEEKDELTEKSYGEMQRLFINIGKLDKIGTRNMIELFKSAGISADEIGKLDIMEKFSFAEISKSSAERAVEILNGSYYKKRKIVIEFANKKEDKKSKGRGKNSAKAQRKNNQFKNNKRK